MANTFSGILLDPTSPFDQEEAREALLSFLHALKPRLASLASLPPIQEGPCKVRIGGGIGWRGAWDVMPFQFAGGDPFTSHPHLGAWIGKQNDEVGVQLVVPNGARQSWKELHLAGQEFLSEAMRQVAEGVAPWRRSLEGGIWEPRVIVDLVHRHFRGQQRAIDDGRIRFDLDTLYDGGNPEVKQVPAWLSALWSVLRDYKQANMQLNLMVCYPLLNGSVSRSPEFIDAAGAAVEAFQPFLQLLLGELAAA